MIHKTYQSHGAAAEHASVDFSTLEKPRDAGMIVWYGTAVWHDMGLYSTV